jgi:hypothetical protein
MGPTLPLISNLAAQHRPAVAAAASKLKATDLQHIEKAA